MNEKVKLSSPWVTYYRQIQALFKQDPEIKISFDEEENRIYLHVDNIKKAEALSRLLPLEKKFGNVMVYIIVVPANNDEETELDLYEAAFEGNPALSYVRSVESPFGRFEYVVFNNEVVQYFSDNLQDVNGNTSTLYQDIAKEVFEEPGVFFCTDTKVSDVSGTNVGKPLGEWP